MSPELRRGPYRNWSDDQVRLFDAILERLAQRRPPSMPVTPADERRAAGSFQRALYADAHRERRAQYLRNAERYDDLRREGLEG